VRGDEDVVLARLVSSPRDIALVLGRLAPDTFSADAQYEGYEWVLVAVVRAQGNPLEAMADSSAMASISPRAMRRA
jgi:hypothetical protein